MKLRFLIVAVSLLISLDAFAYVECVKPVREVFTGYSQWGTKIWIKHEEGVVSYMKATDVGNDDHHINRVLSVVLAGKLAGLPIKLRYPHLTDCDFENAQTFEAVYLLE